MMTRHTLIFICLLGAFALAYTAIAGEPAQPAQLFEFELHLVAHDQPDVTLDKLESARWDGDPGPNQRVDAVCWARNVLLDGKPVFERYREGEYLGRAPRAMAKLTPGPHVIWPGDHAFTVTDAGAITTDDPELAVAGNILKITCYPATLQGFRAGAAPTALGKQTMPLPKLTIREAGNVEKLEAARAEYEAAVAALKPGEKPPDAPKDDALELLPILGRFDPLKIYLPGNRAGKGYLVFPLGLTFHVGSDGLAVGAGGGRTLEGLAVTGDRIGVPLYSFPVQLHGGAQAIFGQVARVEESGNVELYARQEPFELRVANVGPTLKIDGNLARMPIKGFAVDVPDEDRPSRARPAQRALAVEMETRHFQAGKPVRARVRALDIYPVFDLLSAGDAADRRFQDARTKLQQLQQKHDAAEKEAADAQAAFERADARVKALEKNREQAEAALEDAKTVPDRLAALRADLPKLEADAKTAADAAAAATKELADASAELAAATKASAAAKAESDAAAKAAQNSQDQAVLDAAKAKAAALAEAENTLAAAKAKVDAAAKAAPEARKASDAAAKAFAEAPKAIDALAKAAEDVYGAVQRAQDNLARVRDDIRIAAAALSEAEADTEKKSAVAAEARAAVDQAAPAMQEAETGRKAATEALKNPPMTNLLAPGGTFTVFARIQEYQKPGTVVSRRDPDALPTDGWVELQVRPMGGEGDVELVAPQVPPGVYHLRVGVLPDKARLAANQSAAPISFDRVVAVTNSAAGIGLFTERGRTAFVRGESFWIALGAVAGGKPIAAGAPIEVDIADDPGNRMPLLHAKTDARIDQRHTFILRIKADTSLDLAPGRYTVNAKLGQYPAHPLIIHIVDAERPTHFTNLLSGKYNVIGQNSMYNWAITNRGGEYRTDPYWLAREIAAIGYNAFMGHSADGSLLYQIGRPGQEVEELVREMPGLGPWEGWYVPGGRDQFLDAALRYGLHFWENALSYNDTSLPRGEKILDACHRYTTLEAASMRHNPAFQGISLYDEIYERSLIDSTGIVNVFDKAREVGYRARYEGMTSNEAEKSLARFLGRSPQNRNYKDLEKYITWPRWGDYQWQMLTDRCTEGIKLAMPDSQNFALKRSGYNAGDPLSMHGTPDTVFSSLDIAGCVEYKDGGFGDLPVFGPVHADALKARDDIKVFTQLHDCGPGIYGNHVFRQAFFSISQKEHGLIFFNIPHDPRSPQQLDYRETVRNIAQRLTTPYGDLVYDAEPGYRKVAIYASRTADYVDRIMHQCGRLWVGCIRAGFPADFLLDPHVLAGKGRDYDVIFVPGWRNEKQCPPDILAAIERLVNAGKIVAVERTCKLPIEGLVRMDFPLDEWMPATGMTWLDQQTYSMWRGTEQITKRVRDFLTARGVPPVAQHNLTVGPDWLRVRNGMYLVLPDLADTNFAGLHLTLYQAPEVATLRLPRRDGAWYDMLEMKRIEPKSDGDWLVLDADMREYPGKIIAVLPAAIGSVSLQASAKVRAGSDVQYRVAVVDAAGAAIDAGFPLEISIADSAGRALTKIYRTAKPEYAAAWRVPVNAAPPSITLRVRELISGAVAEAAVEVQPSSLPSAEIDTRPVRICDASRIAEFIKTKHTILIAQSPEQQWCRQAAARLAEALAARGLQAKIVDPHSVIRWPAPWNPNAPTVDGSRLWRGHVVEPGMFIDSPVIVLGRRDENVLIEALIRRSLLAEPLTEHFPGAGKALLAWTPRAFSAHHDTLSILAEDEAGLNRGIDALATIDARTPSDPARPVIAAPAFDPAAKLAPAGKHAVEPTSFAQVIGHKDAIRCIEADPATGSILVGTFGYGQNLFCFAKDGSLRWKQFLPDHDVYAAHWCDSGRRVVAGTGEGYWIYVLNGSDGAVVRKFKASHWSNFHWAEGPINTHADIIVQADLKQIIVRGITALFAVDFDGNKLWLYDKAEDFTRYPEKAEQEGTAQFDETGAFAGPPLLIENGTKILQPEKYVVGSRIAAQTETVYVWANRNVVLDAKTGSVLAGSNDDVAGPAPPAWQPNVDAIIEGEAETGHPWIRELDAVDAAGTRLYRCDRDGLIRCFDLASGKAAWEHKLTFSARLHPLPDGLVAGTHNGEVVRFDPAGTVLWRATIADLRELPRTGYGQYVAAARLRDEDSSDAIFVPGRDREGDYDSILRMGLQQLANGDFEEDNASWAAESGQIAVSEPGKAGRQSLLVAPGQLVTQKINRRIVPSATYLLEFCYRGEGKPGKLIAGSMQSDGTKETFAGSTFHAAPDRWTFGRLAVKTYAAVRELSVGFETDSGDSSGATAIRVDSVSLRPIRFPSANLVANAALHEIEPTETDDPSVRLASIPGSLRHKLLGSSRVVAFIQGINQTATDFMEEEAFLHNGRLDDIGPMWRSEPRDIGYSAVLQRSAWISHLVLYLNNAMPDNAYPTISILAHDMETKVPRSVALVRGNHRQFVVLHFPEPIYTDSLKILPGKHRAFSDSLTEVEVYGPLGGPDMDAPDATDADPNAWPMFMGHPTHVPPKLAPDLVNGPAAFAPLFRVNVNTLHRPAAIAADGLFAFVNAYKVRTNTSIEYFGNGVVDSIALGSLENPSLRPGLEWPLGTLAPAGTPALHGPRLLVGCADHAFHALAGGAMPDAPRRGRRRPGSQPATQAAEGPVHLWSFKTGGRVYSSPVPDGDEVYFGSDDGYLYKLDVLSGVPIWDFKTGDRIRSAPALDGGLVYFASWDGTLYAVACDTGLLAWKAPIAPFTDSSPAIAGGRVYIGDESGRAHCFDAKTGKPIWQVDVGGYISACPVVTPEGAFFTARQGQTALISADGKTVWQRSLDTPIPGQPVATQTQLLVPTARGLAVLQRRDGVRDSRFSPPDLGRLTSVIPYRNGSIRYLCVEQATGREGAAIVLGDVALAGTPNSDGWLTLAGEQNTHRIAELRLNAGARGDRIDAASCPWLAFPRPKVQKALPLAAKFTGKAVYAGNDSLAIEGTDRPWLYTSWMQGQGELAVDLGPGGPSRCTVRLHFAEPEVVKPGERVFDVALQDKPVLTGFDIVQTAGGRNRAVIREFKDVEIGWTLSLKLTPATGSKNEPILCAVEVE